jgi:hypothetical protein
MLMDSQFLEKVWGEILSRRSVRIRRMFTSLDMASQQEVLQHLKHMVTEEGWQEAQIISAQQALMALDTTIEKNND